MKAVDWENKIRRAKQVEIEILKWYRKNVDKDAHLSEGYNDEYDIISEKGGVEIKEDRLAHQTDNYALEYETHDGRPSGYRATKAKYFVIVDWENVVLMETNLLKEIIEDCLDKKKVSMGDTFSDGKKNIGWLVPRIEILNHPMVSVYERWFPIYGNKNN